MSPAPKHLATHSASRRGPKHSKSVNLALQGGGSHGAFTWGVLDKILEDDRLWIEAISGTSAGAMNAVVVANGLEEGGAEAARQQLERFWRAVSDAAKCSPIQRSVFAQLTGSWSLESSVTYQISQAVQSVASPYDINPLDYNPLRDLVSELVDFKKVRACKDLELFVAATEVESGRARIFKHEEIDLDQVMASACLPHLFKAVEIDGKAYWDGGYSGNPPLYPFFYNSPSDDIIIIQINPVVRPEVPKSAPEIDNRANEIGFNASLLHELRSIDFVRRLLDNGKLKADEYRRMNMHMIEARKTMRQLDASSKMNAEWEFLRYLFNVGREAAGKWLEKNFDAIGNKSTLDLRKVFQGYESLPQ